MLGQAADPTRRSGPDRCPGAIALHPAQDGALARVRVPGGRLTARQLSALAAAARAGNGLIDLTSRGNLQIRGLPAERATELTERLTGAGLLPSIAHDRARNVIASPVAGRHPEAVVDTDPVVAALDGGLCGSPELAALPGRFLFAVDDGSRLALSPPADVTLLAAPGAVFSVLLAGRRTRGTVSTPDAAAWALGAARAFLLARAQRHSRAWRIHELNGGPELVAQRMGIELLAADAAGPAAGVLEPGRLVQRDGRLSLTGLAPLGRLDCDSLVSLGSLAAEVRLSTRRTVTVTDIEPGRLEAVTRGLVRAGLVLDRHSGWVGLSACAGLGRCGKAQIDVRAAAALRAALRAPDAPREHWSACERRCGQPEPPALAVTGAASGARVRAGADPREHTVGSVEAVLEALAGVPT